MVDPAGAAIAAAKLTVEAGNLCLEVYNSYPAYFEITVEVEKRKISLVKTIQTLRTHDGISTRNLHDEAGALIGALKGSKWRGDLGQAILDQQHFVDDQALILDRMSNLVSEIRPPCYRPGKRNNRYEFPLKSRLRFHFTKTRWGHITTLLQSTQLALDREVLFATERRVLLDTLQKQFSETTHHETSAVTILDRAGYTQKGYRSLIRDRLALLNKDVDQRSFVFHGPTACGKSTVAAALNQHLQTDASRIVVFVNLQSTTLSTERDALMHMAEQLCIKTNYRSLSPETLEMMRRALPVTSFSINLLEDIINDCVRNNAVDVIVDGSTREKQDPFLVFCRNLLCDHKGVRTIFFLQEKSVDTSLDEYLISVSDEAVNFLFQAATRVHPLLTQYDSRIIKALKTSCNASYYIIYVLLFELCGTNSIAEIEHYLPNITFDLTYINQVSYELTRSRDSSAYDIIVITLVALKQWAPATEIVSFAVDICQHMSADPSAGVPRRRPMKQTELEQQVRSITTNSSFFLVERNGQFGLRDSGCIGIILDYVHSDLPNFTDWFVQAYVRQDRLENPICAEIAKRVALVYPASCNLFLSEVDKSSYWTSLLRETTPTVFNNSPLDYLRSLGKGRSIAKHQVQDSPEATGLLGVVAVEPPVTGITGINGRTGVSLVT